jgi:hypothetical protein
MQASGVPSLIPDDDVGTMKIFSDGMWGLFAVDGLAMVSTDDSYIFSHATLVQDVILVLQKSASPRLHIISAWSSIGSVGIIFCQ